MTVPPSLDPVTAEAEARLHVLFAARWYPAFDGPGRGIFVADQAAAITAAGVEVSVASWEAVLARRTYDRATGTAGTVGSWLDAIESRPTSATPASWGAPGVPVFRLPAVVAAGATADVMANAGHESASLLRLGMAIAARRPIDLVHAHTGLPDGIASIALAERLGVPLVVTEHDSTVVSRLENDEARLAYLGLLGPGRRLVAVSDTLRHSIASALGVSPNIIKVVPNVVEVDAFEAVGAAGRDPGELLWVGSRKANKGMDVLLAAFRDLRAEVPTLRLRLIGGAPGAAEEARLQALARDLGIADAVAFELPADRSGVAAAMARAAVFVHPSPYETFGIVAAEALAAGLPVAAAPSGGVPEILGDDGTCGVVAAGTDAVALAAAVREVFGRRSSFDPEVMRARVDRYAPAVVARQLLGLYADVSPRATARPAGTETGPGEQRDSDALPLVVGLRRSAARQRTAAIPDVLAAGLAVVTSTERPPAAASGPAAVARWIEIDPDRGYREACARVGGPLPGRRGWSRVLRVARHPVRTLRLRRIAARRGELAVQSLRSALREVVAGRVTEGRPIEILPLELDDLVIVEPLLDERTRLYPTTLRGMVDRWDTAGRPAVALAALPVAGGPYDPARYWERLHRREDLSAVGQAGLQPESNAWLYRALARNFRAFLRRQHLDRPTPERAFDIGVGIGFWVRFWRSLGVRRVDGCDLVAAAVSGVSDEAAAAGAEGSFVVADIGVTGALPETTYPIVSCFNVLLHVVDEGAFDRALANLAALVQPGGSLILAEPILVDASYHKPNDGSRHSTARPLERYRAPLEAAGLELVDLCHATVLADIPIEAGSRRAFERYGRWWRFVASRSKADPRSARWLGPLILVLDRMAMRTGQAPTTKFALFRRPGREITRADAP